MRDAFGVELGQGDVVLSTSTSGGRAKLGTVLLREGKQPAMRVGIINGGGWQARPEAPTRKIDSLGSVFVVLRKAAGEVPAHILGMFGGEAS
jgi:hypothetical protein